jgi:hypothetical protein
MIDLRERLQELADAAARHGDPPGPAAAIRRGRQRRRRSTGVVAAVLAVALAVGAGLTGRLVGSSDLPAIAPATTLPALPELDLLGEWPASAADEAAGLQQEAQMEAQESRCPGGLTRRPNLIVHFRSAEYRRLVMIGGKPPASGETTICWAVGVYDLETGAGRLSRPVKPVSVAIPLTADLDQGAGYEAVYGQVDKRAYRVRVRFPDQPTLDVPVIQAANQYLVNFYVGLFPPAWTPIEVTAFDTEDRQLASCALNPPASAPPPCPGK